MHGIDSGGPGQSYSDEGARWALQLLNDIIFHEDFILLLAQGLVSNEEMEIESASLVSGLTKSTFGSPVRGRRFVRFLLPVHRGTLSTEALPIRSCPTRLVCCTGGLCDYGPLRWPAVLDRLEDVERIR